MKVSIYCVLVFLLIVGCTSKKEKSQVEDYGDRSAQEGKVPASTSIEKVDEVLKNTATFHTVLIKQMKFDPAELNLHKGDTVLWINKDITDHDVTEETRKAWTSSKLAVGKSWTRVIGETADYYCSIHVVMKGKLVVEE